ncbi:hypothetical protein ACXIZN_05425 [Amycolatopsis sp. TRM77291]
MAAAGEWSEDEYARCLASERERYAWVMRVYGSMTPAQSLDAAVRRYPYEESGNPFRGLVFHDEAWHWAMLALKGEAYWSSYPELAEPPTAYRALDLQPAEGSKLDP